MTSSTAFRVPSLEDDLERPVRAEVALHYRDGRTSTIDMQTVEVQWSLNYDDDLRMSYEGYGWPVAVARMARSARTTVTLVGYGETRFTVPRTMAERGRDAEAELRQAQERAVRHARAGRFDQAVVPPATYRRLVKLDEGRPAAEPAAESPVVEDWYERDMDRGRWL